MTSKNRDFPIPGTKLINVPALKQAVKKSQAHTQVIVRAGQARQLGHSTSYRIIQ